MNSSMTIPPLSAVIESLLDLLPHSIPGIDDDSDADDDDSVSSNSPISKRRGGFSTTPFPWPDLHSLEGEAWKSTYPPLPEALQDEFRCLAGELRKSMELIESRLRELQREVQMLIMEHLYVHIRLSKVDAAIAAHKRLPNEVLENIFTHLNDSNKGLGYEVPHRSTRGLPQHVCVRWKEVALRTPALWNHLIVDFRGVCTTPMADIANALLLGQRTMPPQRFGSVLDAAPRIIDLATPVLARGTRILSITATVPAGPEQTVETMDSIIARIREFARPALGQIKHMRIGGTFPFPVRLLHQVPAFNALHSFDFTAHLDGKQRPRPQDCVLTKVPSLNWGPIRSFVLMGIVIPVDIAHSILTNSPNLESCRFPLSTAFVPTNNAVHLPCLRSLQIPGIIHGGQNILERFFAPLSTPRLSEFHLPYVPLPGTPWISIVTGFLRQSKCQLEGFASMNANLAFPETMNLLTILSPTIRRLFVPETVFSIQMLQQITDGTLLPYLSFIQCKTEPTTESLTHVMNLLDARLCTRRSSSSSPQIATMQWAKVNLAAGAVSAALQEELKEILARRMETYTAEERKQFEVLI